MLPVSPPQGQVSHQPPWAVGAGTLAELSSMLSHKYHIITIPCYSPLMAFTFLCCLRFEVYCSDCSIHWFAFHIFPSKMSANKSNYRLWVAYLMGPGCIIFSQYVLLHWDMQKPLELFAVVQTRRTIFEKRDRQAKLPKEILNPWQTLLATTWSRWKICTLIPPLKADSSGKRE